MNLMFYSKDDDPQPWIDELRRTTPDATVAVHPDIGDPASIDAAIVWKPEPGLLASLPNLKAIFSLGAGVDALLQDPTLPIDVPLVRMVEPGLTEGMTDYVCLHVLGWHRNAPVYAKQQRCGRWIKQPERLARERRVGVMGLGELGSDAARMLATLRFDVAGWSRTPKQIDGVTCFAGAEQLSAFLARSEILVCLLPLTTQTEGILNARTFAQMPKGAAIINCGRGGHLVEEDLIPAIDAGQLSGATLDVFRTEPLPAHHAFWTHPRILVTPHVASITHARSAAASLADNLRRLQEGAPLAHVVDRDRGY